MTFTFDTRKTQAATSLRISQFPLFKYADLLLQLFVSLLVISLGLFLFPFLGFLSASVVVKLILLWLVCSSISLELYLFNRLKIRVSQPVLQLADALALPEHYNLAELLDINACEIAQEAIRVCKKRKLSEVSGEALLYAAITKNKDIQILIFRLGMEVTKLQNDLKNFLEKSRPADPRSSMGLGQERQKKFTLLLSDSFLKVILAAMAVAKDRNKELVSEKELFVALAKENAFFKNVLIGQELKEADVENITLWLQAIEESMSHRKKFWTRESLAKWGSLGKDFASGFTVTLDQYAIDWREIVSRRFIPEFIGHKKEIEQMETILSKSSLSNVLIIGDPGIGKKSLVEALAQRCYLGTSLPELNNKRVMELDMTSLLAHIQDSEKLEVTLDEIFQEAVSAGNIILVIDRLDEYVEQKSQKIGAADISSILAKYLPMENFQFIGITTYEGLHRKLELNPAFVEYFRKIEMSEVTELETIRILQNLALGLEQKYKLLILYPSIREIVNLTGRYFPSTPFPKKAIDVLDEAAVYVKTLKEPVIQPHHIAKIISDKTQIPVGKMEFKEKSVLLNLEKLIHERIVNQSEAVEEISIAMRRARSGISSKKRPMGVFLFLGPTGVGKTETAKALADIYFGGEQKMIRIDMSEFQAISDIARLIGSGGVVEQQGLLTTPVRENPFSLVLLDEIEKAHPNILNLFLQVFDEGHITDGQGRKVVFTNTIIIATSNAGAELIFQEVTSGISVDREKLLAYLFQQKLFKPEFVNRFDATVIFHPLTKENLLDIAQLMLAALQKSLKEKDIDLTITSALKEKIVELSYKPEFGAREMRRVVQDKIENGIAQALIADTVVRGDTVEIDPQTFEIHAIKKNS